MRAAEARLALEARTLAALGPAGDESRAFALSELSAQRDLLAAKIRELTEALDALLEETLRGR